VPASGRGGRAWLACGITLLVLAAAGCQTSAPKPEESPPAVETPAPTTPQGPPEPTACDEATRGLVEQAITGQSEAFAAGEWELAYGFASPSFRAAVTVDQLTQIITVQYDMLLTFEGAEFGRCELLVPRIARIGVEVRSADYQPVIMVYELVNVEDRWWVNAVDVPVSAVPNA